jgi:glycosyltransferase involved in cell wall biosynthesis
VSFFFGSLIVIKTVFFGVDVPGYASLMTIILFLGGIQLIGIGVLGEYIGRMYLEAKRRPVYIIENEY